MCICTDVLLDELRSEVLFVVLVSTVILVSGGPLVQY